ncbi:uncharacterized protein LOC135387707 [Ornithodoros turicata]|uniref:uncharacterized protein LOC135387707 n=1 Tax=Ornithodoros turicata TaxID=34597 RepID=UPI003138632C
MATLLGQIEPFDISNQDSWPCYVERFEQFLEANGITEAAKQRSVFLSVCGASTYSLVRSLTLPKKPSECTYSDIAQRLTDHFAPKPSEILRRYHFHKRDQKAGENIMDYIAEIRRLSEFCNFQALDNMLRDRLVCGIQDQTVQKRLFAEPQLTLKSAMDLALAAEAASPNVSELRASDENVLYAGGKNTRQEATYKSRQSGMTQRKCISCGENHDRETCRFRNVTCNFCQKKGHIERACFKKQHSLRKDDQQSTSELHNVLDSASKTEEVYDMFHLQAPVHFSRTEPFRVEVKLDGNPVTMEVDSGSNPSIINETVYKRLWPHSPSLTPEDVVLPTWSHDQLRVLGSRSVQVQYRDETAKKPLLVVQGSGPCLLGRSWFDDLGIGRQGIHSFPDSATKWLNHKVFQEGLGQFTGPPVSVDITTDAIPIFKKCRPVPFALKEKWMQRLTKWYRTEFWSRLHTQNGQHRLCLYAN